MLLHHNTDMVVFAPGSLLQNQCSLVFVSSETASAGCWVCCDCEVCLRLRLISASHKCPPASTTMTITHVGDSLFETCVLPFKRMLETIKIYYIRVMSKQRYVSHASALASWCRR